MSHQHITGHVNQVQPRNRSAPKQARIVEFLHRVGAFGHPEDAVRTRRILDSVPSATRTLIKNLVDADLVEEITPIGSDTYIFHERLQERLAGTDVGPAVLDERRRLLNHLNNDSQALQVVADVLNVAPNQVDQRLQQGHEIDQMEALDKAIRAVERDPNVSKGNHDYGRIGFRRQSNRYLLTQKGVRLYRK